MIGTDNGMAAEFLQPEAVHRAKPVGWYHIFHRDDLKRIAPLWLKYCGRVRLEPERYWSINNSIPANIPTGDAYVKFGKAPWISEMYGYAFGAAEAGVDHVITHGVVRYPGEVSNFGAEPHILHYGISTLRSTARTTGIRCRTRSWTSSRARAGTRPPPLGHSDRRTGAMRFVVNTLNKAFCGFYHERCPKNSTAATLRCPLTTRPPDEPCHTADPNSCCRDTNPMCWQWALDEQCELNHAFMAETCQLSCGYCTPHTRSSSRPPGDGAAAAAELRCAERNAQSAREARGRASRLRTCRKQTHLPPLRLVCAPRQPRRPTPLQTPPPCRRTRKRTRSHRL